MPWEWTKENENSSQIVQWQGFAWRLLGRISQSPCSRAGQMPRIMESCGTHPLRLKGAVKRNADQISTWKQGEKVQFCRGKRRNCTSPGFPGLRTRHAGSTMCSYRVRKFQKAHRKTGEHIHCGMTDRFSFVCFST